MTQIDTNLDETVELQLCPLAARRADSRHVELIEGSQPSLSQAAYDLLRDRLRTASLLLCGGYSAFLVLRIFNLSAIDTNYEWLMFGSHLAITLVTAVVAWRLCVNCLHALKHLRVVEMLVFGGSVLLFAFYTYAQLIGSANKGFITPISAPWLLIMFTYALLIPNTWKRAAAVIVPMAIIPICVMFVVRLTSQDFIEVITSDPDFRGAALQTTFALALGATVAVWGVRSIRSLRREAFEARQLGQYQLKRLLGSGGMGQVYLAEHRMLKRPCAIKLIRPDRAGDPKNILRFEREVRSTAKLTHWNTVEIYDYGRTDDGTFYYVMEYLPGMSLEELVLMHGPMPAARVVHLIAQACEALSEAHCQGLVHRDIKPANIFAAGRGGKYDVTKLLDFGLVKQSTVSRDVMLTQDGTITGSPQYMSPEQALGEQPDESSDIYSLGAVAYFLLTGRPPFIDNNPLKVMMAHVRDVPTSPQDVRPDIPQDVAISVIKCLQKLRNERFASVNEFRSSLLSCSVAGGWTDEEARNWWKDYGCPKKKQLDAEVLKLSDV